MADQAMRIVFANPFESKGDEFTEWHGNVAPRGPKAEA
jgi:hypothetical protein